MPRYPKNRDALVVVMGGGTYYKKSITITGSSGGEQTDYPVRIDVTYNPKMNVDFSDLRFKSVAGVDLPYWMESSVNGTSAVFWVKVPTVPAGAGTVDINMYYGKSSYADASAGINTFTLFDDFTGVPSETGALVASNAATWSIAQDNYFAENIVFDSVTNKYWWIFTDRAAGHPYSIRLASADTITGPWSVQAGTVIVEAGHDLDSPHIVKFGSTWHIYYTRGDDETTAAGDVFCQTSASVNEGYSGAGITNPVLARGGAAAWDEVRACECFVFNVGATYYMFYMGESAGTLLEKTGYATATDPLGPWTKYASNPVLTGTGSGTWDDGQDKAADPFVFEKDGTYYIGVTACTSGKSAWRIGFWKTTDFITFTEALGNPALDHGDAGAWDDNTTLRGAVYIEDGIYYLPYTGAGTGAVFRPGLATLTFPTIQVVDPDIWSLVGSPVITSGVVAITASAYIESIATHAQNTGLRVRAIFDATAGSLFGFRKINDVGGHMQIISNQPSAGDIRGAQGTATSTGDLADPNVWAVYEIDRKANISALYSVDDVAPTELSAQLPSGSLPISAYNKMQVDWLLVRKYISPEPTISIGSETSGSY